MKRILIIGNAGAGKSTFAKALSQKLGLPLVHLDQLFWYGDWQTVERSEFDRQLQAELEKPQWIIDGNFSRTLPHRLQYCDTSGSSAITERCDRIWAAIAGSGLIGKNLLFTRM